MTIEFVSHRRAWAPGIVGLVLLLMLVGCGGPDNPIGSTTTGTRIAILEQTHTIEPDKDLENPKPNLSAIAVVKFWPQAGYDAAHMMPNAALDAHPKEIWRADIGNGSDSDFKLLARPVAGDGMVFTMDAQGAITAFDAKTGDKKWDFDTTPPDRDENAFGGGLGFDQGMLYATTGFGEVLALHASDGKLAWRHMLMNPIHAAPTIAGSHLYVITIDNELQALDVKTGDVLWHHRGIAESATLMGASNPAVTEDGVIVAYSSGEIFDLRAENGRVAWSYTLNAPTQVGAMPAIADIRGLPVVDGESIYAISHSGRIAAIDRRSGDRSWEADIGGVNTPVVNGDTVFVLNNDGDLVALARDSGRVMWVKEMQKFKEPDNHDSERVLWTGPVLAADRLWLVNSTGHVEAFSPEDGRQLDRIWLSDPIYIPPIVADNTMYVVLDSGKIVALK
jgi:outer membrane protein assembly factor BamB